MCIILISASQMYLPLKRDYTYCVTLTAKCLNIVLAKDFVAIVRNLHIITKNIVSILHQMILS